MFSRLLGISNRLIAIDNSNLIGESVEFLAEYGMFFAKVITFVIAILIIIGAIVSASHKSGDDKSGHLEIKKINDKLEQMEESIRTTVLDDHARKQFEKNKKQEKKRQAKAEKKQAKSKQGQQDDQQEPPAKNVYVLDFDGDIKASAIEHFREEVTAVLTIAGSHDEVVIRLESPGGMVHAYGLAASQMARFRSAAIPLTICVDKVAASGGYMMACIANKLLAAPFAVIGSIGVVASLPNFNKVLKKHDVDYELLTAGEYKRTLTMLGENTEEGRKKFIADLEDTHSLFKDFVAEYRPALSISEVSTGETWYGKKALEKSLIDDIATSDEYLTQLAKDAPVYELRYVQKKKWQEKLGLAVESAVQKSVDKVFSQLLSHWNTKH